MKLYLLTSAARLEDGFEVVKFLEAACLERGVECINISIPQTPLTSLPKLSEGDAFYRIMLGHKSRVAEQMMLGAGVITFYDNWRGGLLSRGSSYFLHEKLGLPVIPTFPSTPENDVELGQVAENLGGFPLIVKVRGGSLGVGVMRVDSLPSFRSVVDYIRSLAAPILIRKYIPHRYYARMVVVGDQVIASHITHSIDEDFRTNAGKEDRVREARVFSPEVQAMAVEAVRSLGLETGGVDLLFDENDQPHIAEVNFPNDFSVTQKITGIDIAGAMVDHLLAKAAQVS
jgi:hypothetical protein